MSSLQQHTAEGVRSCRLAIALDVDDAALARRLAAEVAPHFSVAKVGLQLFSSSGPTIVEQLVEGGISVFVDLKLHDIPNTVEQAARALGRLGASYTTVHAAGGPDMVAAAVSGLSAGAAEVGLPEPVVLAVTVLTSEADAPASLLTARVEAARRGGATGLVCAATDLELVMGLAPDLVKVVPGIRPTGADLGDQARVGTPAGAVKDGADVLVIGRPVTQAADPQQAARAIASELTGAGFVVA